MRACSEEVCATEEDTVEVEDTLGQRIYSDARNKPDAMQFTGAEAAHLLNMLDKWVWIASANEDEGDVTPTEEVVLIGRVFTAANIALDGKAIPADSIVVRSLNQ